MTSYPPPKRIRPPVPKSRETLGYDVIAWGMDNLVHAVTGDPWVPIPEHEEYILTWYQIDSDGRWVYSHGYMRRARGTAKSPLAAVLACAELAGPVRFGGWDEDGYPIAVPEPVPWVQIMATSMEQTRPIFEIVSGSWTEEAIAKYGLEIGREAIVKTGPNRGRLTVIANSPRTLRGARPTAVFVDETSELVEANQGHESIRRINGNLDKNPGGRARRQDLSNAFVPGEDSVAERVSFDWSEQMSAWGYSHILLDSLEANPELDLTKDDELREAIRQAAGDAAWLDVDRLVRAAQRPGQSVAVFRREHLNQITSEEDSLVSAVTYDTRAIAPPLEKGDRVTLGFDGSLSGDGTALVAYRMTDRSFHVLHYQEPPGNKELAKDWRVDEEEVDARFRAAMTDYKVWAAACDVHPFESWVLGWNRDFGDLMKVPASTLGPVIRDNRSARRDLTLGCESMVGEIESGKLSFTENDFRMRSHWLNAKRAENRYGFSFRKATPNSTKRVDIVAACLMAYLVAQRLEAANIKDREVRGTAMVW